MTPDTEQDAPRRWSHCANGLRSHVPQPGSDRWWSTGREGEPDCWCAVCDECGYYVWLTPDWEKYPSRTTDDDNEGSDAEAIVRDLAICEDPMDDLDLCVLCGEHTTEEHDDRCPWRRAREWVASSVTVTETGMTHDTRH